MTNGLQSPELSDRDLDDLAHKYEVGLITLVELLETINSKNVLVNPLL